MSNPVPLNRKIETTKDRVYDMRKTSLGGEGNSVAKFDINKAESAKKQGGLASDLIPSGSGIIDVAKDYPWTLSPPTDEIPYIWLNEYRCTKSQILRGISAGIGSAVKKFNPLGATITEIMDMYNAIMPKDNPSGFHYKFPYFNKSGFELGSPDWREMGSLTDSLKDMSGFFGERGKQGAEALNVTGSVVNTAMHSMNAAVGVVDRPKVFMSHQDRSITISFTLFNTFAEWDWTKNRDLAYLLMSQNLFNKRDYITGVPPVFYDVYIPGQYYSFASAMTNIKIDHLGNQRLINEEYIIPDAYQFELTLTELVKPSKNQFESISNGYAKSNVTSVIQT